MNSIQSRQMDSKSEKDAYVWFDLINLPETNHTPQTKKEQGKKGEKKKKKAQPDEFQTASCKRKSSFQLTTQVSEPQPNLLIISNRSRNTL